MEFKEISPCLYEGKINCEDCKKSQDCDMEAGRELHKFYFEAGKTDNQLIVNDHNKTLNMIRAMGVPETRSKYLSSAFMTLINRMDKEISCLNQNIKQPITESQFFSIT